MLACGDEDLRTGDTAPAETSLEVVIPDTGVPEVIVFDTAEPDTTADTTSPDASVDTDTVGPSCTDNPKPFFCPCDVNAQCASSLCIAVDEDNVARRCTVECALECPQGWECKGVTSAGDTLFVCQPPVNNLCKPCERAADCQKVGALCIAFGDGRYCGQDCQNQPNSCPAGYSCQEVLSELGQIDGYQCIRTSGSCICPDGTNYQTDPNNCSVCGNVCNFFGAVSGCRDGACYLQECTNDYKNLNGVESDGCEYRCTFQSAEDWPDGTCNTVNDCDQNCDGIDGDYARAIFVSATGAANAQGTPYDPVRTISEGLSKASPGGRDHVYVAAGTYNEVVTLKAGVSVFGGYSNDGNWTRNLALHKTTITSSTGASSIRVVIADGITTRTVLDGVEVLGGTNANPGGSSYAIWIKDSTSALELVRVTAIGGNGGNGRNGSPGSPGSPGVVGQPGGNSSQACTGWPSCSCTDCNCNNESTNSGAPGAAGTNQCSVGTSAAGGRGGRSGCGEDNNDPKAKVGDASPGGAAGGTAPGPKTNGNPGSPGGPGGPGTDGGGGAGGGTVNASGFWNGIDGGTAGVGSNGIGGGGGSGGGGANNGTWTCASWGGPGGGGGSGGCGGTPGQAGTAGGGSFGVFLYNASPTLRASAFGHKAGGNGGSGGTGGGGGSGFDGGAGGTKCEGAGNGGKGGMGGNGGRGGHGGGGAGGVAYGLYIAGTTSNPTCNGLTFASSNATGGLGGASSGNKGTDGVFSDKNRGTASCP